MRLHRTFEDNTTDILNLRYRLDRCHLFMTHANGSFVQLRYFGDSMDGLDAVRETVTIGFGRRSPPSEPETLYQPGDECYGPIVENYGDISEDSLNFLKSVWVFIDPEPRPVTYPWWKAKVYEAMDDFVIGSLWRIGRAISKLRGDRT